MQISLEPKISCIADPSLTSRIAESKLFIEILSAFLSKLNFWRFSAFFLPFLSKFKISHFTFCRSEDFLLVKFPSASEAKSLKYGSCPSFRGTPPLENSCLIYFPSVLILLSCIRHPKLCAPQKYMFFLLHFSTL